jgi:hypothetical protein
MFNLVQHFINIKKIYSLNFKIIFIIKYILGIFEKKIIQFNNNTLIKKFKKVYTEGSYLVDWTTANSHNFISIEKFLKKIKSQKLSSVIEDNKNSLVNLRILEIGSFEGYSANIFNIIFTYPEISCVDPWIPYSDNPNLNFNQIEKNFDMNSKKLNVKKFKMFSYDFFKKNTKTFDLIYIDGSHRAEDVFNDAIESYKVLNKGGILFFDDFLGPQTFENDGPINGIALFLKKINSNDLKLIFVNSQVAFLKI